MSQIDLAYGYFNDISIIDKKRLIYRGFLRALKGTSIQHIVPKH